MDWITVSDALNTAFNGWMGLLFSLYIAFVILAVMNVITGVFVESALLNAKNDQDVFMINNMRDLFESVTASKEHEAGEDALFMTWEDFEGHLDTIQMKDYFKSL